MSNRLWSMRLLASILFSWGGENSLWPSRRGTRRSNRVWERKFRPLQHKPEKQDSTRNFIRWTRLCNKTSKAKKLWENIHTQKQLQTHAWRHSASTCKCQHTYIHRRTNKANIKTCTCEHTHKHEKVSHLVGLLGFPVHARANSIHHQAGSCGDCLRVAGKEQARLKSKWK